MKDDLFNFDESLADGFATPKNNFDEKLKKARILCIRGRFEQALAICEEILDEDMENMGAYIEILRVHSEDFTVFEGEDIDKDIHAIERLFPDIDNDEYIDYLQKRRKSLKNKNIGSDNNAQSTVSNKNIENSSSINRIITDNADSDKKITEEEALEIIRNSNSKPKYIVENAKSVYEEYAQSGSAAALCNIGYFYASGDYDYEVDQTKAFEYNKKSADLGNVTAMYNIGIYYSNGIGTRKNQKKAFEYFKKAADKGDSDGMFKTGCCYRDGSGVDKNINKAIEYFKKADQNGNQEAKKEIRSLENAQKEANNKVVTESSNNVSTQSISQPSMTESTAREIIENASKYTVAKVKEAKNAYEKYAENGSSTALCTIGYYYDTGNYGYVQNKKKAFDYYVKSAKLGNVTAYYNLGICYMYGHGGIKDEKLSFEYYKKSADAGDSDGMYQTAKCYENGSGVTKNITKATEYYKLAIKNGNTEAQNALNKLQNSPSMTENEAKEIITNASKYTSAKVQEAKRVYETYAKNGSSAANCNIGLYYSLGKYGYTQNRYTAFSYYKTAASLGSKEAMFNLGIYYKNGYASPVDLSKSFEYYKKSADLGDIEAYYETGKCYEYGTGTLRNITKAVEYYRKGAQNGNQKSKDALRRLGY